MEIQISPLVKPEVTIHPTKNGGSYKKLEISYKDLSKDGKVAGKKLVSFNDEDVFKKVAESVPGTVYNVRLEKEGEYWQWKSFDEALGEPSAASAPASTASTGRSYSAPAAAAASTKISTYETAEERKLKQRYIVRQSSITAALDLLKHNSPKNPIDVNEVIGTAKAFEAHVFGESLDPVENAFADMTDDIPE